MTILGRRLGRLEAQAVPAGRLLVVSGPAGFDAAAALADRDIFANPADLLVAINKPVGAPVSIIRGQ